MKTRRALIVSVVLLAAIAFHYAHALHLEGGLVFGLIQDITSIYGFYTWDTFSLSEFKDGFFPLWNSHNALGEPHIANMQTAFFYPLTWLKFIFDVNLRALDLLLLLRLYLAGIFTYLFMRRIGAGAPASIVSALSFMLTGYFTRHVYMSHLNVEILIPLVMLCFGELARKGDVRWLVASAASVYLTVTGGFPEATFYALMLGAFYFAWIAPLKRWPLLVGVAAVGLLASAVQLLPFFEYVANGWFYHPPGVGLTHRDIKYFFTLWAPWFFGANDVSPLVPFLAPYFGLLPMTLAIVAIKKGKGGHRWFFLFALLVCLGLIYGIPPFGWLAYLPVFNISLNYKYAVPPAAFCIATLAGMGAGDLLEGRSKKRVIVTALVLAGLVSVAVAVDKMGAFAPFSRLADVKSIAIMLSTAFLLIPIALIANEKRKNISSILLVALAIFLPVTGNQPHYIDSVKEAVSSNEANFLKKYRNAGRFTAQDHIIFPNINLILGIDDLRYYNPIYTNNYADYIKNVNGIKGDVALRQHFADHSMLAPEQGDITRELLNHAALKWWIGEGPPGAEYLQPELMINGDWRIQSGEMIATRRFNVEGLRRPVLSAHAPAKVGIEIDVSEGDSLRFRPVLHPESLKCTDGANFTILVDSGEVEKSIFSMFIDPGMNSGSEYTVSLSEFRGRAVRLKLIATPGPMADMDCDWSGWASVSLGDMEPEGWERLEKYSDRLWERIGDTKIFSREGECDHGFTKVKRISAQKQEITSPACKDGVTSVGYAYYPGWRAFRNHTELQIVKSKGIFQGIEGGGNFHLIYMPAAFRIGLWTSLVSIIVSIILISIKNGDRGAEVNCSTGDDQEG